MYSQSHTIQLENLLDIQDETRIIEIVDSLRYKQGHFMDKELDSVLYYTNLGLKFCDKVNYLRGKIQFNLNLGIVYQNVSQNDLALDCYNKALTYSQESKNYLNMFSSHTNIGNIHYDKYQYTQALKSYNKGLDALMKTEKDHSYYYALAITNIGNIYKAVGKNDAALEKYEQALNYYKQNDKKKKTVNIYNLMAKVYEQKKEFNKALDYYNNTYKLVNKMNGLEIRKLEICSNLASFHLNQQNFELAEKYFNEYKNSNVYYKANKTIQMDNHYLAASLAFHKNDIQEAKEQANLGLELSRNTTQGTAIKISELLLEIAKKENDVNALYKNAKNLLAFQESIKIKYLESAFFKEELNLEVAKVKLEEANKREIQNKKQLAKIDGYNFILRLVILIIIVLGIMIWFKQRRLNSSLANELNILQLNNKLELKIDKLEKSVASDLHDNFGNRLSGLLAANEIIKNLNKNTNSQNKKFIKFSYILEKSLSSLTSDIKDLIWANKENNNIFSLMSRVELISKEFEEFSGIKIEVIKENDLPNLDLSKFTNKQILLVIKESLTNALKHSKSPVINVLFSVSDQNKLVIKIKDYGKGFDFKKLNRINGINNMKQRVELVNFDFNINSSSFGTQVTISSQEAFVSNADVA